MLNIYSKDLDSKPSIYFIGDIPNKNMFLDIAKISGYEIVECVDKSLNLLVVDKKDFENKEIAFAALYNINIITYDEFLLLFSNDHIY